MDYEKAIKFPVHESDWIAKVAVGSLVGLVPVVNFAQQGYALEVLRRVAYGEAEELPAWDQFGRYFVKGLGVALAGAIWSLPALFVLVVALIMGRASGLFVALGVLIVFVYMVAVAVAFPAAMMRYALTDRWGAMLEISAILAYVGANAGRYITVLVIGLVIMLVAGAVGSILLFVGAIVTSFWATVTFGHLLGQLSREAPMR